MQVKTYREFVQEKDQQLNELLGTAAALAGGAALGAAGKYLYDRNRTGPTAGKGLMYNVGSMAKKVADIPNNFILWNR